MVTRQEILNYLNAANPNERIWKGSIENYRDGKISLRDFSDGNLYNLKTDNVLPQSLRRRGNVTYLWTSEQRSGSFVFECNYNGTKHYWTVFPQEEFLGHFPNLYETIVGSFLDKERLYSIIESQAREIASLRREVQQISGFSSQIQQQLKEIKDMMVSLSSSKDEQLEQQLSNLQIEVPPKK